MRKRTLLFLVVLFCIALLPFSAGAQSTAENAIVPTVQPGQFDFCTVGTVVKNVVNFTITIAIAVSALMFGIAGFYFFTSGGDASRISKGKTIFTSVVIGIAFVIGAWLAVDTIIQVLTNQKYGLGKPWVGLVSGCSSPQLGTIGKISIQKDGVEFVAPTTSYCDSSSKVCYTNRDECITKSAQGDITCRPQASQGVWCNTETKVCHSTVEDCYAAGGNELSCKNPRIVNTTGSTDPGVAGCPNCTQLTAPNFTCSTATKCQINGEYNTALSHLKTQFSFTVTAIENGTHKNSCHANRNCMDIVFSDHNFSVDRIKLFQAQARAAGFRAVYEPNTGLPCPGQGIDCQANVARGTHFSLYRLK